MLKALTEAIIPLEHYPPGMDLTARIAVVIDAARSQIRREFKLLLFIVEYILPFLHLKFRAFSKMSRQDREQCFTAWERSRFSFKRTIFQAIRRAACAAFYGAEESWAGIHYEGTWLKRGYPHDFEGKSIQVPNRS